VRPAARLVTRSRVVHVDAARSMRAAFTERELRAIARRAGLRAPSLRRRRPWAILLVWDAPPGTHAAERM
jgi:hypothetical protein